MKMWGGSASKISKKPDIVIPIVRGGLIPGRLLAKHLGIKDMYAITVKKLNSESKVSSAINEVLNSKNVLLVEDVLETGTSMMAAKDYLIAKGALVQTAALYFLPETKIKPDYYISEKPTVPIFPWD
jgi:hypoxanthine phosphoribosyltransferase